MFYLQEKRFRGVFWPKVIAMILINRRSLNKQYRMEICILTVFKMGMTSAATLFFPPLHCRLVCFMFYYLNSHNALTVSVSPFEQVKLVSSFYFEKVLTLLNKNVLSKDKYLTQRNNSTNEPHCYYISLTTCSNTKNQLGCFYINFPKHHLYIIRKIKWISSVDRLWTATTLFCGPSKASMRSPWYMCNCWFNRALWVVLDFKRGFGLSVSSLTSLCRDPYCTGSS